MSAVAVRDDYPLEARLAELRTFFLRPPSETQAFRQDILSGALRALCPCTGVVRYRLAQLEAEAVLRAIAEDRKLLAYRLSDLRAASNGETADLTPVDPAVVVSEGPEIFAYASPDFQGNPKALLSNRDLQQVLALPAAVQPFFPDDHPYILGKPLGQQAPHSDTFRVALRAAFQFLARLDLLSRDVLETKLAHTSVLMIIAHVLDAESFAELPAFIADPPRFFANRAAASICNEDDRSRDALRDALLALFKQEYEIALAAAAEGSNQDGVATDDVRRSILAANAVDVPSSTMTLLSADSVVRLVGGLATRHQAQLQAVDSPRLALLLEQAHAFRERVPSLTHILAWLRYRNIRLASRSSLVAATSLGAIHAVSGVAILHPALVLTMIIVSICASELARAGLESDG